MRKSTILPIDVTLRLDVDAVYDTLCAAGLDISKYDFEEAEITVKAKVYGTTDEDESVGCVEEDFDWNEEYIEKNLGKYFYVKIDRGDYEYED